MKFTILTINPYGDGYTHLYLNKSRITEGDYYHNKIDDYINGYIHGFTYAYDISQAHQVVELKVEIERIGFNKDEWEYEDFSAEKHLDITIKKLKNAGFIQVKNE